MHSEYCKKQQLKSNNYGYRAKILKILNVNAHFFALKMFYAGKNHRWFGLIFLEQKFMGKSQTKNYVLISDSIVKTLNHQTTELHFR